MFNYNLKEDLNKLPRDEDGSLRVDINNGQETKRVKITWAQVVKKGSKCEDELRKYFQSYMIL